MPVHACKLGTNGVDNFRPSTRSKVFGANTEERNGYLALSVSDIDYRDKMQNRIRDA